MATTYMTGALYWPFVSLATFRFVPTDFRVVANSLAGVLWNIYLSYKANAPAQKDGQAQADADGRLTEDNRR